ncbi:MAG: hypothetical protein EAZ95_03325 [Bacteroidetes bacterium]|nr:MAG: hypothetical protein EAZ95_03325 [Bacteroidota bacterium]
MKYISKLTLALFCAMLLVSIADAQAQKKPKLKGLAKEMIGNWSLDDFDMKLDESKADSTVKKQFEMMKMYMGMMKEQMKGKVTFTFNADGTYTNTADQEGESKTEKGTWTMEGNKLKLKPETPDEDLPEFFTTSMVNKLLTLEAPAKKGEPINMVMKFAKK